MENTTPTPQLDLLPFNGALTVGASGFNDETRRIHCHAEAGIRDSSQLL
jgi:hypothetical protein